MVRPPRVLIRPLASLVTGSAAHLADTSAPLPFFLTPKTVNCSGEKTKKAPSNLQSHALKKLLNQSKTIGKNFPKNIQPTSSGPAGPSPRLGVICLIRCIHVAQILPRLLRRDQPEVRRHVGPREPRWDRKVLGFFLGNLGFLGGRMIYKAVTFNLVSCFFPCFLGEKDP